MTDKLVKELAFKIAVDMELHAAIGTTTEAKAKDIAAAIGNPFARIEALEAENASLRESVPHVGI